MLEFISEQYITKLFEKYYNQQETQTPTEEAVEDGTEQEPELEQELDWEQELEHKQELEEVPQQSIAESTAATLKPDAVGNSTLSSKVNPMKTVVLWIYNINQNGTANSFHEEMSRYFTTSGSDGSVLLRDMGPELLLEFLASITTAKEIQIPDLGIRLILLIYNCNQNGASNAIKVAYEKKPDS